MPLLSHRCPPVAQGLARLGLQPWQVEQHLAHVANMAAHQSFLVGQLPPATHATAATWLARVRCAACAGLCATLQPLAFLQHSYQKYGAMAGSSCVQ